MRYTSYLFNYTFLKSKPTPLIQFQASKASIIQQVNEGKKLIDASPNNAFALIIDGNSLTYALGDDVKELFLALATGCASVICCRSSPKQKALVSFFYNQPIKMLFIHLIWRGYEKCRSQDLLKKEQAKQRWALVMEQMMLVCFKKQM